MVLLWFWFRNTVVGLKSHSLELIVLFFGRFGREEEHQMLQVQVLEKKKRPCIQGL